MSANWAPGNTMGQMPTKPKSVFNSPGRWRAGVGPWVGCEAGEHGAAESRTGPAWRPPQAGVCFSWLLATEGGSEGSLF